LKSLLNLNVKCPVEIPLPGGVEVPVADRLYLTNRAQQEARERQRREQVRIKPSR
jgi:hypothetical protein